MAARLMTRPDNYLLNAKRLFQMYIVDRQSRIESERLNYLRFHQNDLRSDTYRSLHDGLIEQDGDAAQTGRRVILPSTFTDRARYLHEQAADAMTYATRFGKAGSSSQSPSIRSGQNFSNKLKIEKFTIDQIFCQGCFTWKKNVFWTWSRKTKYSAKYRHTSTPLIGRREDYPICIFWFGSQQIKKSERTTSTVLFQRRYRIPTKILNCTG